jgi:hypothetical protein
MEITDLNDNPILRKLLTDYCIRMYEEDAITDDDHLMMEYFLLKRENKLNDLFIEEKLLNYFKHGNEHTG